MGQPDPDDGDWDQPGPDDDSVPDQTDPALQDAMDELAELADIVDSTEEREQVREAMDSLEAARPRPFGRLRDSFGLRDAGEALVGGFIFGIPMVVEQGTFEIGAYLATRPLALGLTAVLGLVLVLGILRAVEFEKVQDDLVFGRIPVRLLGILFISVLLAITLLTVWGRVDWGQPRVAGSQTLVTAIVMAIGASLGDILPGT